MAECDGTVGYIGGYVGNGKSTGGVAEHSCDRTWLLSKVESEDSGRELVFDVRLTFERGWKDFPPLQ